MTENNLQFYKIPCRLDLLVSDTWLDTGIGYWYRYPMTRYYERLLDTGSN